MGVWEGMAGKRKRTIFYSKKSYDCEIHLGVEGWCDVGMAYAQWIATAACALQFASSKKKIHGTTGRVQPAERIVCMLDNKGMEDVMRKKLKCLMALYLLMYTVCGAVLCAALLNPPVPLMQLASIAG